MIQVSEEDAVMLRSLIQQKLDILQKMLKSTPDLPITGRVAFKELIDKLDGLLERLKPQEIKH